MSILTYVFIFRKVHLIKNRRFLYSPSVSFLILYHAIQLIVTVPLQCQHLFLGYYSKYGYMKVWNIFPIGYGTFI